MLIRTNALRSLVEAELGGIPVSDRWNDITALLTERCGADVAQLFAEPSISRSNGASEAIARWYSESDGPAVSFAALDSTSRATAAAQLTSYLSRLEPLLRDPQAHDLIGACLYIPSMSDVMLVGGRPVLVNWGFLPEDFAASQSRRETHFRTTLGQFLPGVPAPAFTAARAAFARAGAAPGPAMTAAGASAAAETPSTAAVATTAVVDRPYRPWLPVAIATAVALVCLLVLLIPGVLIYPDQDAPTAEQIALRREANRSLEEQIEKLRKQLAEAVCTPQSPTGGSPRTSPPAEKPPGESPAPKREGALPTPNAPVAIAADNSRPLSNRQLVAAVEQATVMVIVVSSDGSGVEAFGSGFFVNPSHVVTNRHVVQTQPPGRIFVTNKTLSRPLPTELAAVSAGKQPGRDDFAVLRLEQATNIPGLPLALKAERLDAVTAAGYPGTLLKSDPAFLRLINGDGSAMPEMSTTQGIVTAMQGNGGSTLIFHSAMILGGNSGGPLVDACGRAVAVNTFTRSDQDRPASLNGALSAVDLRRFLESGNVSFAHSEERCEGPSAVATMATPPAPPAPAK